MGAIRTRETRPITSHNGVNVRSQVTSSNVHGELLPNGLVLTDAEAKDLTLIGSECPRNMKDRDDWAHAQANTTPTSGPPSELRIEVTNGVRRRDELIKRINIELRAP